jgi:PTS system glucitol/sorbitol-specific IIC component
MELITNLAQGFMSLFTAGGETFMGWVTGIIPTVVCLMTAVNSIIKLVGTERVEAFAAKITKYAVLRYTLLPLMAVFFLGNPMCYTFGRFVDEKYKPAYYDAAVSFVHPITGLFPHANAGELFVYMGIATGLQQAGSDTGGLAIRYFIVGLIVILIRGLLTERIYLNMLGRNKA